MRSKQQVLFHETLAPTAPERTVEIVALDKAPDDTITLKFMSGNRRRGAREVSLSPGLAEQLLTMLALEIDGPRGLA